MKRRSPSFVVAGILAACLAAAAWAHDNVIDLEEIEAYVAQQDAATLGGDHKVHKLWVSLGKKLDHDANGRLAVDLGKLASLSKASDGTLVDDVQLRALLDVALNRADERLAAVPDEVAALIGQIRLQKDRDKVLKAVLAARTLHDEGKVARDAGDEKRQISRWTKADAKFLAAKKLANRTIKRQGGPLPQFKTAEAGRVYTVVGTGLGGFNGDNRDARRSTLYFVEECRVGPDGLLYILDWNNHRVRRRAADGTIEPVCGSGIPGDSEGAPKTTDLNHPSSLVFEPTNDGTLSKIYLAAWHNHKVKVYDPVGDNGSPTVYTIAGTTQGGAGATSGDGGLATSAKYNLLPGIVRLPNGDLLTADAGNSVIRKISLTPGTTAANLVGTQVHTGQIDLFAGTRGTPGNGGDGGNALGCTLNFSRAQNAEPDGRMELSPDGTKCYVICGNANCVRVIDLAANPPTIERFAGTGAAGYAGDGAQAKDALLNRPADIAVSPDGTVFISDSYNNVIRKVAADGTISTYAGAPTPGAPEDDVPVASAVFRHPAGLELDANGNLYVCDRENSVIRVITSADPGTTIPLPVAPYEIPRSTLGGPPAKGATGVIDTYAGIPPDAPGLASDESFVAHTGFDGDHAARDTTIYWPQDVAVDPNPLTNLVYVVDWNNHRIRRIEQNGDFNTVVGSGRLGDLGGEGPDAKLNHPTDITFHPTTGELWVAAWHTDKVFRLDSSTSQIMYMAGNKRTFSGDGGVASNPTTGSPTVGVAEMNLPVSVKFTANGDWYVADEGNQVIRRIDGTTDIINTIAGTAPVGGVAQSGFAGDDGPALSARFDFPIGQAAQPAGRIAISPDEHWIYVADANNHRVRRIDLTVPERTITTVAGDGTPSYAGDGGQAKAASLNFPCDVDCDVDGNLYIADRDNCAIRKVDVATGVITTIAGSRSGTVGIAGYAGDGGPATKAWLNRPCGIFVVRSGPTTGRVYVADTYNSIVRAIWE